MPPQVEHQQQGDEPECYGHEPRERDNCIGPQTYPRPGELQPMLQQSVDENNDERCAKEEPEGRKDGR